MLSLDEFTGAPNIHLTEPKVLLAGQAAAAATTRWEFLAAPCRSLWIKRSIVGEINGD
jgi:hypothetical protein